MGSTLLTASTALWREYRCLVKDKTSRGKPLYVTPDILRKEWSRITDTNRTIIFIGFGKLNPLVIPRGMVFKKDIWIVTSILESARDVTVDGDINFINCSFNWKHDFKRVSGVWNMDDSTLQEYMAFKRSGTSRFNHLIRSYGNTQMTRYSIVQVDIPIMDFFRYCKAQSIDILHDNTTGFYLIDGDLDLIGPYIYNVPKIHLRGDLRLSDTYMQPFHKESKVTGRVQTLSYF